MSETKPTTATTTPAKAPAKRERKPAATIAVKVADAKAIAKGLRVAADVAFKNHQYTEARKLEDAAHKLAMAAKYAEDGQS